MTAHDLLRQSLGFGFGILFPAAVAVLALREVYDLTTRAVEALERIA